MRALAEFKAYAASTLLVLDLIGTFVFALSGAVAAIRQRLDLFGVLVLSFAAASSGGVMRDLLIGSVPPAAISDWRYLAVALLAGLVMFFRHPLRARLFQLHDIVMILDAAGLAVFAVTGTQKALGYGLNPIMAALLGMLTGIGGGMVRDFILNQIPTVLRSELYAVAALACAVVVVAGSLMDVDPTTTAIVGSVLCFGIRLIAIRRGWGLPAAKLLEVPQNSAESNYHDIDSDKSSREGDNDERE
jgi:uncharacterized membrane protein YeiH